MAKKPLPDLTVRVHELHDAAFRVATVDQAYQNPANTKAQKRAYLDNMEAQLRELRGQTTLVARAIRAHRKV